MNIHIARYDYHYTDIKKKKTLKMYQTWGGEININITKFHDTPE